MCLKKEKILKSMFHCSVNDVLYADIYQFCTGFNISFSQTVCTSSICTNCENDLLFIYEFKQKIQDNEEKLEKLIHIKNQNDHSNAEIETQFLGIDDNFLDYRIELLDDMEKTYNECKFKAINDLNLVKCTKCIDDECETEKLINAINLNESFIIVCEECDTAFFNRENFLQHYTQVHIGTDKLICNDKNHKFAHSCSNSLKEFYNDDRLMRHEGNKIVSKNSNIIWKCLMCNIKFMREESLNKHFETAHVEENCEFIQESSYSDNSATKEEQQKISKSKNKSQMTSCKICGAYFRHRSTKIAHMIRDHNAKKPLECNFGCGFTTLKKDRFQAHIDKHENPEKIFNCPICNQAFKSYNYMTLHRAKHTSSSTTLVCTFCNKTFLDRRNYKIHLRLHTKEKLFHCDKCERGFNRKEHLKNHLNRKGQCDVFAATSNLSLSA